MIDKKTVEDWKKAKKIIEKFMEDVMGPQKKDVADKNSSALIARLAHEDLLIVRSDDVKE